VIEKISILSSAQNISGARLHRLSNTLIRAGFEVHIWAPGEVKNAPAGSIFHKTLNSKTKFARVFRDLTLPLVASGDAIMTLSPDLLPVAYLVTKVRRKKLIADINENYLKLLQDRNWARGVIGVLAKLVARTANLIASKADLVTIADTQVPPFKAKNRLVVKNLPDSKMIPDSGALDATPRAIYIGDIRKSRGLYSMLRIAELSPKWTFDFIGNISNEDKLYVDSWLKNSPAAARVKFHGRLDPNTSWNFAKGAWVGLTLLESTPAFIEAVPSKLYEYAYAGLAIISSPLPRCVELINKSGGGIIAQSDEGAANVLNSWAANQDALLNIRKKAQHWAKDVLNPDAQYEGLRQAVEGL
jgi:glycosyltransferase involved in cell wall biosynthesis